MADQPIPFSSEMLDILGPASPSTEDEYLAFANTFLPPRTPPALAITDVKGTRERRVRDAELVGDAYRSMAANRPPARPTAVQRLAMINHEGANMTEHTDTHADEIADAENNHGVLDPFTATDEHPDDVYSDVVTVQNGVTYVGTAPASTGRMGESTADDVRSLLAEAIGGFSPMPEDMQAWRLKEVAEGASPTIWNEARRALEDSITSGQFEATVRREHLAHGHSESTVEVAIRLDKERARKLEPWRVENPAHLGQAWLSLDSNPRDDRVFAYLTSSGQQRLLMVTDSTPDDDYATWEPTGFRDVSDAPAELRLIQSAVRVARDLSITDDFSGAEDRKALVTDDFS